jgi:hypothetical protein
MTLEAQREWKQELAELRKRVERLEQTVRRMQGNATGALFSEPAAHTPTEEPADQAELLAWLKREGAVVEPPPDVQAQAERWRSLPEEEKISHIQFMRNLKLDPPLSQIVIEGRR